MVNKEYQYEFWKNKNESVIFDYFYNNVIAIRRSAWFAEFLKSLDVESVFELGFFSGRNLFHIKNAIPNIKISGIEINEMAIGFAKEKIPESNLVLMNAYEMDNIKEKFDIVFSSGVLIHIVPQDVESIVKKMIGISKKYIIHLEEQGNSEVMVAPEASANPKRRIADQWQWSVDLKGIYKRLGYTPQYFEIPQYLKTNGAENLVVVKI